MSNAELVTPKQVRELFADGKWWKLIEMALAAVSKSLVSPEDAARALEESGAPAEELNGPRVLLYGTAAAIRATLRGMIDRGEATRRGGQPAARHTWPTVYLVHPLAEGGLGVVEPPLPRVVQTTTPRRIESRYGVRPSALLEAISGMDQPTPKSVQDWLIDRIDYVAVRKAIASRKRGGAMAAAALSATAVCAWVANEMIRTLVRQGRLSETVTLRLPRPHRDGGTLDTAGDTGADSRPTGGMEIPECGSETTHS